MPSFLSTIAKGTATVFRYPVWGAAGSASGGYASWNDWLINQILPSSDFDYITEAGEIWKNAIVSSALRFLLSTWPEPTLVVKRMVSDPDKEDPLGVTEVDVRDHPLLELLEYPNEDGDDITALEQMFCLDFNLWGAHYWLKLKNAANRVIGLQPIPFHMMSPAADPTGVRRVGAYVYYLEGKRVYYPVESVIHFRFGRDPRNIRNGFQPLTGACRDICTENELSTLAASVARNMGIAPYVVSPMSTDEEAIIPVSQRREIEEKFNGSTRDKRGLAMVLARAFRVDRIGFSPDELMADKARDTACTRILGPLGLDPMVLGMPSPSKTFSNLKEAMDGAAQHNLIPVGDAFCSRLTKEFRYDPIRGTGEPGYLEPNERLAWDYSKVGWMQERQEVHRNTWREHYKVGVATRFEAKRALGLPANKDRDDVYIQDITPVRGAAGDIELTEKGKGPAAAAGATSKKMKQMLVDMWDDE